MLLSGTKKVKKITFMVELTAIAIKIKYSTIEIVFDGIDSIEHLGFDYV